MTEHDEALVECVIIKGEGSENGGFEKLLVNGRPYTPSQIARALEALPAREEGGLMSHNEGMRWRAEALAARAFFGNNPIPSPDEAVPASGADVLQSQWACQAWSDGSSPADLTNVVCPDCEVVIAVDLPIVVAVHIASLHNEALATPAESAGAGVVAWRWRAKALADDNWNVTTTSPAQGDQLACEIQPLYASPSPAPETREGVIRADEREACARIVTEKVEWLDSQQFCVNGVFLKDAQGRAKFVAADDLNRAISEKAAAIRARGQ